MNDEIDRRTEESAWLTLPFILACLGMLAWGVFKVITR